MRSLANRIRSVFSRALRRRAAESRADETLLLRISETVSATEDQHRRRLVANRMWTELSAELALDADRLARIEEETERVSALLDKVYAREAPPPSTDRFPGLERRHAVFLAELAEQEAIRPEAFAALARRHALLPDGAMEAINDWAFDRIGETVLNDGDPIEIARDLLRPQEERQQMRRF